MFTCQKTGDPPGILSKGVNGREKNKKAFRLERLRESRANLFTCQKTGEPPGMLSKGIMEGKKIKMPFDWKGFVAYLSKDR